MTPANVSVDGFGKLFSIALDGHVPAQPLYVSGLSINGVNHNILYVATEHDSVYAFDADDGTQLWKRSMVPNGETVSDDVGCPQITPEMGVTATPVIDRSAGANGTMYVQAMTQDGSGAYHQRLHAIDLLDGHELDNSPVDITATYPGKGDNSTNGQVVFDPKRYKERTALTLANGKIYTFWASHCDTRPYTGFMMAYDASTLKQTAVWNTDPNGNDGSVWGAGAGPAVDPAGNLVFLVGNGSLDTNLDANGFPTNGNIGNSFIKLSDAGDHMQVLDYFSPFNTLAENAVDEDLGSG
ncbi:MAG TPA: PQQ-binding-like beta-propeller repeat protein, partial [Terriglobales bacterium]